jgi:hypothetical protein
MPSKIEVNAAIDQLLAGEEPWQEFAQVVLAFMKGAPIQNQLISLEATSETSDDELVEGFAPGVGTVQAPSGSSEVKEWSFGAHKERVGHYKLQRKREDLVVIQPFWRAEVCTNIGGEFEEYVLTHNPSTFEPQRFGIFVHPGFRISFTNSRVSWQALSILKGKDAGKTKLFY